MYFIPWPCFVKTFGPTDEISSWRSCGTFFISCRPDFQSLFRFHCGILDGPFNYKISTGQTILSTWEGHRVWCPVNSRPAFSCTVCGKSFAQKSSLMVHKQIHTGVKFACDMCPKLFSRKDSLRLHKKIHTNQLNYKCGGCTKKYVSGTLLRRHWKTSNCKLSKLRREADTFWFERLPCKR